MKGILSRAAAAAVATALLAVSTIPVSAASAGSGPVLVVSNPAPNDYLRRGRHIITGVAYDPAATSSTGVDQVTVFLGDRDAGGTFCRCGVPGGYLVPPHLACQIHKALPKHSLRLQAGVSR